jgi:hypothetical protein
MMPVNSPSRGLAGFWEEFDAQYDAGGFFMLVIHPFLTGRLARWKRVEAWIVKTQLNKNVWFATLEEIANHMDQLQKSGTWQPTIEKLPYYDSPILSQRSP